MSSEFDSGVEDVRDHTKWLWIGIVVAIGVMIGAMAIWGGVESDRSQVVVRHILIQCNFGDSAEVARARQTIEELRERIVDKGEDFAKLARNYSQDPQSSSRGGMLPPAAPKAYEEAFDDYAWTAPLNVISEPIRTNHGFHLVEVIRRDISASDEYEKEIKKRALERMREEGQSVPEEDAPAAGQ